MHLREPRRTAVLASVIASLVILGAGCGKKPPQNPPSPPPAAVRPAPAPSEPPVPPPPGPAVNLCDNPYFALAAGMRIEYESSDANGKVSPYTMTVMEASAAAAKLSYYYPATKYTFAQEIVCKDGSVTTETMLGAPGASGSAATQTKRSEGQLLPKDVHAGSTWSASYETVLTTQAAPGAASAPVTMTVDAKSKAVGEEQVTVPAGTFTAMKVETTSTANLVMEGAPPSDPRITMTQQWWVKGLGLVRSVSKADGGTTTVVATKVTR
ncbi:MAG TPA: hypothetical protein VL426_02255 [Candidatus Binatia bacterium]|jgi:hypothetical protein|nr:hypothetical protein [Candidatus Binatia bacterium]